MITKNIHKIIWAVISISLLIHFFGLVAQQTILQGWQWEHHPVHASVEISGTIIALLVAGLLLSLERQNKGTNFNIWIAGALTAMGLLDGFHALTHSGNTFVWLHSTATFAGGILFVLVWLPHRWERLISACWIPTIIVITVFLALSSMLFPDALPLMVLENKFTIQAKGLNILGGLCLFGASVRLFLTYFSNHNVDNLLFCLHCLLFGSAAIMFEQSELWDIAWWGWHVLRLMAYGIAFWFVILTVQQNQQDITKTIKQINFELEELVKERTAGLEAANKELEAFAYSVSHDLRAPLRRMDGFSRALLESHVDKLNEEGKHYLERVCAGAQGMGELIDALLDLSRITRRELKRGPVDLRTVAYQIAAELQKTEPGRDVEFVLPKEVVVDGDKHLLQVAFENLVGNAWKFTGKMEKKGRIEFGAARNAGCGARNTDLGNDVIVYFVRDNGAGFDMAYANKLFGAFQRLHREDEFEGTGIGLATVQRIIQKHGGRVWAEGALGKGATFYFTLGA